jgi:hypothetical protein
VIREEELHGEKWGPRDQGAKDLSASPSRARESEGQERPSLGSTALSSSLTGELTALGLQAGMPVLHRHSRVHACTRGLGENALSCPGDYSL